ncbi:PREDICTED: F-box/LRR-repeat protein 15-like isoform X2 [Priapulus caudatus]|uniref:F-box/LRR-repeat protein 15-like isoform X2 n=1 Tax=Priapulus caudatus TaxID=37621 RepID=A0ABM1E1H3_PRICU|nr:PREDICTED: F-box/LRR-repeat protein 15-like isoform X2 [Priapulus caudatus]
MMACDASCHDTCHLVHEDMCLDRAQTLSCGPSLLYLPWEDVLCRYVLCRLSLHDLFRLRQVNRAAAELVKAFFGRRLQVDLTHYAGRIPARSFHTIVDGNRVLRTLVLANCRDWLDDSVLCGVITCCPRLQHVDVSGCSRLTDATPRALAAGCPDLDAVVMRDCHWLSASALAALALGCRRLQRIDVESCWAVDDAAIKVVLAACCRLQNLSLCKIYGITDATIREIAYCRTPLTDLNISGCWRVTDDSIRLRLRGVLVDRARPSYIPLQGESSSEAYLKMLMHRLHLQI